jgi:hypothetical protein
VVWRVPLGPLAPDGLGFGLGLKPVRVDANQEIIADHPVAIQRLNDWHRSGAERSYQAERIRDGRKLDGDE